MSISIPFNTIESYARVMRNWDKDSKARLVDQLVNSRESKTESNFSACFGAWQDDRDAEEIVREIYDARQNSSEIEAFS